MSYLDTVLTGELHELRTSLAGRNNSLFRVAARLYQFVEAGVWSEEYITDQLIFDGRALGLPLHELRATLKSARRAAAGHPATLPSSTSTPQSRPRQHRDPEPPATAQEPPAVWQEKATAFLDYAQDHLWSPDDERGLAYLVGRGLDGKRGLLTIWNAQLGYNPTRLVRSRSRWGIPDGDHGDDLVLPAGIVIPYHHDRTLIKVEIRGIPTGKYTVPGSMNALWNADRLCSTRPAILVEGVFNALSITQEAGDLVVPVAIGAATHARRVRWLAPLAAVPLVLIATDAGAAGDAAAAYWLDVLRHNAQRWRPYTDDANAMLLAGMDIRAWVQAGLDHNGGRDERKTSAQ